MPFTNRSSILVLEDNLDDFILLSHQLKKAGVVAPIMRARDIPELMEKYWKAKLIIADLKPNAQQSERELPLLAKRAMVSVAGFTGLPPDHEAVLPMREACVPVFFKSRPDLLIEWVIQHVDKEVDMAAGSSLDSDRASGDSGSVVGSGVVAERSPGEGEQYESDRTDRPS